MVRRSTVIVAFVAIVLIAFAVYWNQRKTQQAASTTPTAIPGLSTSTSLFSASEGSPKDIKIQDSAGKAVEIARNDSGVWVLKAPTDAPASQGASEAAASQLAALRVLSSVQIGLNEVGLDKPSYIVIVSTPGKTHTLNIGAETPLQDGYYTTLDGGPVRIVDKAGLDALITLVNQPPYEATLTPAVIPTIAATATTSVADTPAASSTSTQAPSTPAATSTP